MTTSLEGKVIAVQGAASGIGAATARLLASRGAILALADVNIDALAKVANSIRVEEQMNGRVQMEIAQVDIRDRKQVKEWLKAITDEHGPLDGAANIAGVIGQHHNIHSIWELSTEEFDFINDVNSKGLFHCLAEQLIPGVMKPGGSIVNVASICGLKGIARTAGYTASKHAAVGLSRAAAVEGGQRGIRVNAVAPGTTETPMLAASLPEGSSYQVPHTPIARSGLPVEIGSTLAFLLSDESKFTTGAIYSVDGGWSAI